MVANAGTIEAQLILNASQFQKGMNAVMASVQAMNKGMLGATQGVQRGLDNTARSIQNVGKSSVTAGNYINSLNNVVQNGSKTWSTLGNSVSQYTKTVQTAQFSTAAMGNSLGMLPAKAASTTSALSAMGGKAASGFSAIGSGAMVAGNALAGLTNAFVNFNVWMGVLVGKVFYDFTVGAALARDESLSLFKFVGMGADEVKRLEQATSAYAASASKVSQPEMLSAWKLVRLSQKLSADEMINYQSVLGDTIGLFKSNGRTAEDAGRAIEDAMAGGADGIKRLKEIGISDMQELYQRGFDPSKPATFFAALQKLYEDRGVTGYGSKVTSLADRFENLKEKIQLAGIAAGEFLMPGMEALVNGLTAVFNNLGPQISGALIALTGLTVILGFFWPTLVSMGTAAAFGAGSLMNLMGTSTKYGSVVNKATGETAGLSQALGGMGKAAIASAGFLAVAIAALIGTAYYIGQNASASAAWNNIEKQREAQVQSFTNTTNQLNEKLADLKTKRDEANASGQDATEINRQISETEGAIASNTNASAAALERYNQAVAVKKGLETLGEQRQTTATTEGGQYVKSMLPEELGATVGDPEYQAALEQTATAYNRVSGPAMTYAGTMKRIAEGQDNYSKVWKENPKQLAEYNKQYGEFLLSNKNFNKAVEEQNIGGMIFFGLESAFNQADVGIMEIQASVQSWWKDLNNGWAKSGQDAQASVDGIKNAFGGAGAYIQGAWGNTVAYLQGAWGNTVAYLQGAWNNTILFFQSIWDYVVNFIVSRWNWAVAVVMGNPVVGQVLETGAWVIQWIMDKWAQARAFVASLPIVGQFLNSGGPSIPAMKSASSVTSIGAAVSAAVANASQGPGSSFLSMASGFTYLPYAGIGQNIAQTLTSSSGNCVDGTMAQLALAQAWGIPAEMVQSTWMGNPHVYARIGGVDRDIANHALTGSWSAPPRGPRGSSGGNIIINGDVYGFNDFKRKVEQANNSIVRGY